MLTNVHDVWNSGQGSTFTLQLEITVPEQIVIYPLNNSLQFWVDNFYEFEVSTKGNMSMVPYSSNHRLLLSSVILLCGVKP